MKKLFASIIVIFALLVGSQAMATWTLTPALVAQAGHYVKWSLTCTSNASALSATDILAVSGMPPRLLKLISGSTLMLMKVYPGESSVIPDTTINIILSDDEADALYTKTAISKDAISWHDLSSDIDAYPPITGSLYLTLNDIGSAGDQVTLYFICWRETI